MVLLACFVGNASYPDCFLCFAATRRMHVCQENRLIALMMEKFCAVVNASHVSVACAPLTCHDRPRINYSAPMMCLCGIDNGLHLGHYVFVRHIGSLIIQRLLHLGAKPGVLTSSPGKDFGR